jgi:hypothetical protein
VVDRKVLPFARPAAITTRRTPVASWVSESGGTTCTFLIETTSKAKPKDRAELVAYIRDLANLFESDVGRSLFEEG